MHDQRNRIIQFFYKVNFLSFYSNFSDIGEFHSVLDVGSGTGFLKQIFDNTSISYQGIESDLDAYHTACNLYGKSGFINGYFPRCFDTEIPKFDLILVLTCIDEVPNVKEFLDGLKECMHETSLCYIAVRNKNFIINKLKIGLIKENLKGRSKISLSDLTYLQWTNVFIDNGFTIVQDGKYFRPWLTGFNLAGIKNVFYRLFSYLVKTDKSYMNFFILKL